MGQQRKHKLYTFKRKHKWYIYTRGYEQPCYEWFCQTKEAENGFDTKNQAIDWIHGRAEEFEDCYVIVEKKDE